MTKNSLKKQNLQNQTQINTDFGMIREFKITVVNMLRALIEKVDNMQVQMGNVSKEMGKKSKGNPRNEAL